MVTFLRRSWDRYVKLGKGRKKKQRWRSPTGRDNKMREKRKGYPVIVSIGYRTEKQIRGKLRGKTPITIMNISDLKNIQKNQIAHLGKVGKKKKMEIIIKAKEMKIEFYNANINSFLSKNKLKTMKSGAPKKTELKDKEKKIERKENKK